MSAPIDLSFLRYPDVVVRGEVFESKEVELLLEDLIEVELPGGKFIDMGWYPEHDANGQYVVRLWRRGDPRFEQRLRTPNVDRALRFVEQLIVSHLGGESPHNVVRYETGARQELISLQSPIGIVSPSTVRTSLTADTGERVVLEYA